MNSTNYGKAKEILGTRTAEVFLDRANSEYNSLIERDPQTTWTRQQYIDLVLQTHCSKKLQRNLEAELALKKGRTHTQQN